MFVMKVFPSANRWDFSLVPLMDANCPYSLAAETSIGNVNAEAGLRRQCSRLSGVAVAASLQLDTTFTENSEGLPRACSALKYI
jgi:hypothetical protein